MVAVTVVQTKLFDLARATGVEGKIRDMAAGKHINITEDRAVMHTALRAAADQARHAPVPVSARPCA